MKHFALYPQQNKIHIFNKVDGSTDDSSTLAHQFPRRWECQILLMLLTEGQAGRALTSEALQQILRLKGQTKELNRAQLQRLFGSLNTFLTQYALDSLILSTEARQATVGPWTLKFLQEVTFEDVEASLHVSMQPNRWPYPSLLLPIPLINDQQVEVYVDIFFQLLSDLLTSDAFAVNGDYKEAIDTLQVLYQLPLSEEFACVICLREALWQKRMGYFDMARTLTQRVLENPQQRDLGLAKFADFFMHRINYDESPAQSHAVLWHSTDQLGMTLQADWRNAPEWHNLRALLARRRLLSLSDTSIPDSSDSGPVETPVSLHQTALNHLQSAIYWAVQQRDWDRLQAYTANTAFHMQSVMPLGFVTASQVFKWHRLCLAYGDKLSLAQDSGWEFIFLGKFWLDHHVMLSTSPSIDPLAHTVDDTHPSQQSFYLKALDKLKQCADERQLAIMWVLYGRFATDHLSLQVETDTDELAESKVKHAIQTIEATEIALIDLMNKHSKLRKTLQTEGYGQYLPVVVI